jgi:hypothetical protein
MRKRGILLNVDREIHEGFFSGRASLTPLTFGDGNELSLEHLLYPGLEVNENLGLNEFVQLLPTHLVVSGSLNLNSLVFDFFKQSLLVATSIHVHFLLVVILI